MVNVDTDTLCANANVSGSVNEENIEDLFDVSRMKLMLSGETSVFFTGTEMCPVDGDMLWKKTDHTD